MPAMAQVGVRRASHEVAGAPRPRLERSRTDRVIGGVAAGIAQHLGVETIVVRAGFVLLSAAFGFGIVVYLLTWLLAPEEAAEGTATRTASHLIRPTMRQALGPA